MLKITKAFISRLKKDPIGVLKTLDESDIAHLIQKANYEYYHGAEPMFSDNTFDVIKEYLESLNPSHPILKSVGAAVSGDKVKLPYFMGSLDKIKTEEKVLEKFKGQFGCSYIVSDKLDGNSAMYFVDGNGKAKLFTRGDGEFGQDISHLIPFIQHIPTAQFGNGYCVRGELIISKKDFETVSGQGANARNMVAGVMNAKVPDLSLAKLVQFVAYELIEPKFVPEKQMEQLKADGFKCVYNVVKGESMLELDTLSKILLERRKKGEFEIDGIVVIHNAIHPRQNENPKYGFAFKSIQTMEKAEVIVQRVEWNMSKDKYMKPIVIFNPVKLSGVTVQKATGFNGKYISENRIGPGSRIVVMRSGDVIPYISEILSVSETGEPQMPEILYVWSASKVDIIADIKEGDDTNDEVRQKNLETFFEKVDFKGIGKGVVAKMYNAGLDSVDKVLGASKEDLLKVEGFKDKMAEKILQSIDEGKKKLSCALLMDASNTLGRGFGTKKIELITSNIPSIMTQNYVPSVSELVSIKGVEQKTAQLFVENLPKFFAFLKKAKLTHLCGVASQPETQVAISDNTLKNIVVVFTGVRSKEVESYVTSHGGKVATSVNKKTTVLVVKSLDSEKESAKYKQAKELGIKVLTLDGFKKEINF